MKVDVQKKDILDELQKIKRIVREQEMRLEAHLKRMGGGECPSEPSLDKIGVSFEDKYGFVEIQNLVDSKLQEESQQQLLEAAIEQSLSQYVSQEESNEQENVGLTSWESQRNKRRALNLS